MIAAVQALDPLSVFERCLVQTKPDENAEAGRLQQESGADGIQHRRLLEYAQRMPLCVQHDRCRLAGRAVTDDGDA